MIPLQGDLTEFRSTVQSLEASGTLPESQVDVLGANLWVQRRKGEMASKLILEPHAELNDSQQEQWR